MAKEQRDYHSYLLRLWRTTGLGGSTWHAMLENPHTGERHGFANLAELFTFLENKLDEQESLNALNCAESAEGCTSQRHQRFSATSAAPEISGADA